MNKRIIEEVVKDHISRISTEVNQLSGVGQDISYVKIKLSPMCKGKS